MNKKEYELEAVPPPYTEQADPLIPKDDSEDIEAGEHKPVSQNRRLLAWIAIALIVSSTLLPLLMYTCSTMFTAGQRGKSVHSYAGYVDKGDMDCADKKGDMANAMKGLEESMKSDMEEITETGLRLRKRDEDVDESLSEEEKEKKKKLESAQKEIDKIRNDEESKLKEIKQNSLKILEREISIRDQEEFELDLGLWNVSETVEPAGRKVMVLTASDGNGANSEIKDVLTMAEANRREYCNYHNYVYKFINISRFDMKLIHPVWGKLKAIELALEEHPDVEWIWWMDLDMIIMNPEIDLARYVLNPEAMKKRLSYGRPLKHPSFAEYSDIRTGYNPDEPLPSNAAKPKLDNVEFEDYEYADVGQIDLLITQDFFGLNAGSFFIKRSSFVTMLLDYWADPIFIDQEFRFREQDTLGHLNINHRLVREHVGIIPQRMLNSYISDDLWDGYSKGDLAVHFAGCWIPGDCDDRWMRHWTKRGRVPEKYRVAFGDRKLNDGGDKNEN